MGRLLALIFGGAALLLFVPPLIGSDIGTKVREIWIDVIGLEWYQKLLSYGPGIFAGVALVLFAVRGGEGMRRARD